MIYNSIFKFQIEKKIYDDAYNMNEKNDIYEDCTSLLNRYLEQSKGAKKTIQLTEFFSKTINKNIIEYINKLSKYK